MADIILGEHHGQTWLLGGEHLIDDLLANTLPENVSIEFRVCESHSEIMETWAMHRDPDGDTEMPWRIHPNIARRIRRESSGYSIQFGAWSAMIDDDSRSTIAAVAADAAANLETVVIIAVFIGLDAPRATTDMANLRCALIEGELTALGVAPTRQVRIPRDQNSVQDMEREANRVDLVVKLP